MIIIYHCNYRDSLGFDAAFTLMGGCYFFAVNGYLILSKDRTIIYNIKKIARILSIIIIWGCISIISSMLYRKDPIMIKSIAIHFYNLDNYYCNYLWFMIAMTSLYIIAPILKASIKAGIGHYILILIAIAVLLKPLCWKFNFLSETGFSHSILWYILGFYILSGKLKNISNTKIIIYFIIACISYISYDNFLNIGIIRKIFGIIYNNFIYAFMIIFSLEILRRIPYKKNKFIELIARNTLGIYLLQGPIYKGLIIYFPSIENHFIIFPLLVTITSLFLTVLIKKCQLGFLISI